MLILALDAAVAVERDAIDDQLRLGRARLASLTRLRGRIGGDRNRHRSERKHRSDQHAATGERADHVGFLHRVRLPC